MSGRYPALTPHLATQLTTIRPSRDGRISYYPCLVTLQGGQRVDCVYLAEADEWFGYWGVWPEEDRGKRSVSLRAVVNIEDSPSRLPPRFANELYSAGESGMGYTIFTVEFAKGIRAAYQTGNAIDFIEYPKGKTAEDVIAVHPHEGRRDIKARTPDYYWCLFERDQASN